MADGTMIEWTDATWNPITGCSIKSPGCINCYAQTLAGTRLRNIPSRKGLTDETKNGPVFNGKLSFNEGWLDQPLLWKRPRRIFVCAHGDLFHENAPDEWIDKVFAVMALAPQHQFQVLTKRADRMRAYLSAARAHPVGLEAMDLTMKSLARDPRSTVGAGCILQGDIVHLKVWPLPNVWLGVSAERQKEADERIPLLLQTPAAKRFISAEPLIGPISFRWARWDSWKDQSGKQRPTVDEHDGLRMLDWVIVGGESGRNARPMHPDWARSLRDQCAAAGVPFFFKQHGNWVATYDRDKEDSDWQRCGEMNARPGRWLNLAGGQGFHGDRVVYVENISKKAAGRHLDGQEHSEFPQ